MLIVARVGVDAGCKAEGSAIADLERATASRVLLLTGDGRQSWCPPGETLLQAGQELVVVVTRGGLARVLANTEVELTSHLPKEQEQR